VVTDLDSRNGLLVNARRCESTALKMGDVITIAMVNVVFSDGGERHLTTVQDEVDTGSHLVAVGETQTVTQGSEFLEHARKAK
jgi:pSer/pThr/pTyr-binding forkhead associated (FHA) protein